MEKQQRTVIIAGGGISGLSLANMLEKAGVNYILLESYDKIAPQSKDTIYPGQAVKSVMETEDGVQVLTDKGKVFKGDILVGADGIYSTVREEMWRIGNKESPGYFPTDEWSTVPCYYKCIFGLTTSVPKLTKGTHYIYNDKFSYLVMVGPGGKFYFFLFVRLPVPLYGKDIPRYTKEDEKKLAEEHAADQITPEVTFGDLYEARTNSTLTPLHEWVFQKWHYNRIITIGDAAHKFEPLTGHGGNCAIESAASVVNHLLSDECSDWTTSQIQAAFSAVQAERHDRVQWLVDDAHKTQEMQAKATPILSVLGPILGRLINTEVALRLGGRKLVDATRVNSLPIPHHDHKVPFTDELPAKPLSSWIPIGFGILSQGALFRLANQILLPFELPTTFAGEPLVRHYTGHKTVDKILSVLVAVFGVPLASQNKAVTLQFLAFTPVLFSTVLDWTLESYRGGSKGLLSSFPSVFGIGYQLKGIGRIAPLYHLISTCETIIGGTIMTVAGRSIDKAAIMSAVTGIGLGYILPTALMSWPFNNKATWQQFAALWQPFPVWVGLITAGTTAILRKREAPVQIDSKKPAAEQKREMRSLLRKVYIAGAAGAALIHFWSLYRIVTSRDLSISSVFGTFKSLLYGGYSSGTENKIFNFLQRDMFLNVASVLAHSLYRTLDLRCKGYITNKEAVTASLATMVAQPIVGPAAAHIGFLGWREEMFARVHKRIEH
ncbi:uncharacterized protein FIESC28_00828 [Fusarium coffeatum]|uniref:FAD-binding domain-containing protein n=1 Tax=Fusarium coffeatum TaxID=231269 RepID=A0A366SBN3_9HYPO|nr:uncharacterized protein FIESC28_00828 [Fusarium coffeatum]RBR26328.1 hypothetical protein FIESC28_00828 [Fusarium coffeatum]